jgi:hypothetical protein
MKKQKQIKIRVELNGTDSNPWHIFGLTQNPIPQLGKYEYDRACLQMQKLGGPPIPHDRVEEYIRKVLKGFDEEFVKLCVDQFKPGEIVRFEVFFPE